MKVEAIEYGDRRVYSVAAFNRGVGDWLARLPTVWVEGEVTELRRQDRWQSVFLTLKDPADGACLGVTMPRGQFDALRLDLENGERVHVYGRPELFEARGDFRLRALTIERFGLGEHLAALERLKRKLADEGLFAAERKRPLPRVPRRIGLVTGNDAAAKRDVISSITARFPPARILIAETYVQGPRAAGAIVDALARDLRRPRDRRRRPRPRRRKLRGPAPLQRRAARPCDRRVRRPGRVGGRPRAGHSALGPRRGRARLHPDRGREARRARRGGAACPPRPLSLDARSRRGAARSNANADASTSPATTSAGPRC